MVSNTGRKLEALSTQDWTYLKNVTDAFKKGAPMQKDILSNTSKDLQELLTQAGEFILPKPQVFADIYNISMHKHPLQTLEKAEHMAELYKKFGVPAEIINTIISASRNKVLGAEEVFCGHPVYEGEGHAGYCPIKSDNVLGWARDKAYHRHWNNEGFGVWETAERVRHVGAQFEECHPLRAFSEKCKGCIYYNVIYGSERDFKD